MSLGGQTYLPNATDQIYVVYSDRVHVGDGASPGVMVVAVPPQSTTRSGINVRHSKEVHIEHCNIGIGRDGKTPLSAAGVTGSGITLYGTPATSTTSGVVIGGTTTAARNAFGSMRRALNIIGAHSNQVFGNHFGLSRNGLRPLDVHEVCIDISDGSLYNAIGGQASGQRNVICGGGIGVFIEDPGTNLNNVKGNWFGTNAAGNEQLPLTIGVLIGLEAGSQNIGAVLGAPNYFCVKSEDSDVANGVLVMGAGDGSTIAGNWIGKLPNDTAAVPYDNGIALSDTYVSVLANGLIGAEVGIACVGTTAGTKLTVNAFRDCDAGVKLTSSAEATLGNAAIPSIGSGYNFFHSGNQW